MYPSKGYLWVNWLAVQKMEEFTGPWPGLRTQMSQVILNQMPYSWSLPLLSSLALSSEYI